MKSVPPRGSGWVACPVNTDRYQPLRPVVFCIQESRYDLVRAVITLRFDEPSGDLQELSMIMWNDTDTPLAYFISFRTYGTWLHGDKRGSIDRFHNRFRSPYLPPNKEWRAHNKELLKAEPLILKARHRKAVEQAIRETCEIRKWYLQALNVRTNHIHSVVSASHKKPSQVLGAFKANATRELRQNGLWRQSFSPWADEGSKRKLWNEKSVARAIDYVLNGQGDDLPDFEE